VAAAAVVAEEVVSAVVVAAAVALVEVVVAVEAVVSAAVVVVVSEVVEAVAVEFLKQEFSLFLSVCYLPFFVWHFELLLLFFFLFVHYTSNIQHEKKYKYTEKNAKKKMILMFSEEWVLIK